MQNSTNRNLFKELEASFINPSRRPSALPSADISSAIKACEKSFGAMLVGQGPEVQKSDKSILIEALEQQVRNLEYDRNQLFEEKNELVQ